MSRSLTLCFVRFTGILRIGNWMFDCLLIKYTLSFCFVAKKNSALCEAKLDFLLVFVYSGGSGSV